MTGAISILLSGIIGAAIGAGIFYLAKKVAAFYLKTAAAFRSIDKALKSLSEDTTALRNELAAVNINLQELIKAFEIFVPRAASEPEKKYQYVPYPAEQREQLPQFPTIFDQFPEGFADDATPEDTNMTALTQTDEDLVEAEKIENLKAQGIEVVPDDEEPEGIRVDSN